MNPSITRRLLVSNLLILAAFLGLAGMALDRAFRNSTVAVMREQLQAHVYTLLTAARVGERGLMRLPPALAAPAFNQPDSGVYAEVRGEDGAYHWRSNSLLGRNDALVTPTRPGRTRFRLIEGLAVFDQGITWEDAGGNGVDYSLTVAVDRRLIDTEQSGFRTTLWIWLSGVALLLLAAQLGSARWGLAPLRHMSAAVRRIEAGEASGIEGQVPTELRGLSDNLNSLIAQSRARQERVRNSLADLAHSMKPPLAVLRGSAEQANDPALRALIVEQTGRIDEIVSYQRQRAAVAGGSSVTPLAPLAPILRRLCTSLDKVHRERSISSEVLIDDALRARFDEGDLFELFGNLLENAYKHCLRQVRVTAEHDENRLRIDVEDDGEGIALDDAERLLRRGERADQRHPGEGIGLAVVSEIVAQYQGTLEIGRSELGGARLRLSFPP
ncbi:MAG: GHKL domain-containing protein [Burkholderiales bacterium]|nr:MAG: GHKL domain-containing protein [Burkholderiales bacterium]